MILKVMNSENINKHGKLPLTLSIVISIAVIVTYINIDNWWASIDWDSTSDSVVIAPTPMLIEREQLLLDNRLSESDDFRSFEREIERTLRRWKVRGASVAVMDGDRLVYAKGFGYSNIEEHTVCQPYNLFRIASMSKLITAVAIMRLCDDGKLSLSSKVFGEGGILSEYKELKDKRLQTITVEHLLRHEGGFTTPSGDPLFKLEVVELGLDIERPLTPQNTIEHATSRRLGFTPGARHRYSNVGYLILSQVIEKVSGQAYEDYVKSTVLEPAGCYDTHIAQNKFVDRYDREVTYYSDIKDDTVLAYDGSGEIRPKVDGGNNVRGLSGAGGWVSTTTDLLRLYMAIDGDDAWHDVISKESTRKMLTGDKGRFAIGWADVSSNLRERTGTFSGTTTIMRCNPNGYKWVVLSNTGSWIGYRLNNYFTSMMRTALSRFPEVSSDVDLFSPDYVKEKGESFKQDSTAVLEVYNSPSLSTFEAISNLS